MEQTFVVTGGQKHIKKKKPFFLPEVFVENEEGMRHRSSSLVRHSTPYQNTLKLPEVQSTSPKLKEKMETTMDSGFDDWSIGSSRNDSSIHSIRSDYTNTTYKTPSAKPVDSLWESFASPLFELKGHFKSKPSFVDDKVKIKLNLETLVTACLGVVMFSSIVFSVYVGTHTYSSSATNGKYRSIEFGVQKRIQTLREEGRIIDYDIKDENGNVLGGKRAAIQYAYEKKYGKDIKTARRDAAEKVAAAREPTIVRRVDNEIQPRVIKATVEEPIAMKVPDAPEAAPASMADLSRKIDELNTLLQDDLVTAQLNEEKDIDEELAKLKEKKKKLMEKVKAKPSSRPVGPTPVPVKTARVEKKPVVTEASAAKNAPAATKKAVPAATKKAVKSKTPVERTGRAEKTKTDQKKPKTKVENPLTKDLPQQKQSKAKKAKKNEVPITASDADSANENEGVVYPGTEDYDVDPGMIDYPDDPTFRGRGEI